jgi:hypothetical protein
LGRAFNDLPELLANNEPEEARVEEGTHLAKDDATGATIANPAEDEIAQVTDSSAIQSGADACARGPKRSLDTKIATASASAAKRPRHVCTMKTGTMLLGEHSLYLLICSSIAVH